jgi:RNA polymerase sigma-70 factor (ECF subfamily)
LLNLIASVIPTHDLVIPTGAFHPPGMESGGRSLLFLFSASNVRTTVLPKKYLNKTNTPAVFMNEVKQLVAGEAILNEAVTVPRSQDRSRDYSQNDVLEDLVRQHSRLVYRIAYAALRSHPDAEDATQETFLRVLRYSHKLATVDDTKTWVARIAWRVAVDRSRQRGRKQEIPLEDPEKPVAEVRSVDAPADKAIHDSQVGAMLDRLITALPEKLREPLILSAMDEMSPREIAATLGINEAAVRSRVFRARNILKEKLAERVERK